jgi:hypothetical protein
MLLLPRLFRFAMLRLGVAENISDKDRNAGSRDHNGRLQPFAHLCLLQKLVGGSNRRFDCEMRFSIAPRRTLSRIDQYARPNQLCSDACPVIQTGCSMRTSGSYRGIMILIPGNDDGVWRYSLHLPRQRRRLSQRPQRSPLQGFSSQTAAIAAAENAIDIWLSQLGDGHRFKPARIPILISASLAPN